MNPSLIERASRLIYLGLDKGTNLSTNDEFKELLRLYKNNSKFRVITRAISSGMSLDILNMDNSGIYLRPHRSSIFAKTRSQIRGLVDKGADRITSVILVALAAYYFPKDTSFDELSSFSTLPITIHGLDEFIRRRCRELKEEKLPPDHIAGDKEVELLLTSYDALPAERELEGHTLGTSTGLIRRVFTTLKKEGLFVESNDKYYATAKFRYQMENMVENENIKQLINDFRKGDV